MDYMETGRKGYRLNPVKASTLVEALVAGTLFMIVFLISMSTATAIMSVPDVSELLEAEQCIGICLNRCLNEDEPYGRHEYRYDWGLVSIDVSVYSEYIRSVSITAEMNGGQTVDYKVLIPADGTGGEYGEW